MKHKNKRQRGMTLLEVMVALMIFAIGCLALIKTTGGQVRSLSILETKSIALWVADNQLALLQLGVAPLALAWHEGTTEMAGETWHWRYRSRDTTDVNIRAIEIEVRRDPQEKSAVVMLQAYKAL